MEAITGEDESVKILVAELQGARKGFEGDLDHVPMHMFPAGLRGLGDRYIAPKLVAIGPYHHRSENLHKMEQMEQVKREAAFHLIVSNDCSPEEVYRAVHHVAANTAKLYADADLKLPDSCDLATLMFYDACFLLYYMEVRDFRGGNSVNASLSKLLFSNRACIDNDIMLLENQLPLRLVRALIQSLRQEAYKRYVERFIERMGSKFNIIQKMDPDPFAWDWDHDEDQSLLGLLRRYKTAGIQQELKLPDEMTPVSSAIELAEIGIKLTASKTPSLADMSLRVRGPFLGQISLAPLSLNETTACLLVNMAALEVATGISYSQGSERTIVCSYLSLFSMLMLRDEDVHELRAKQILSGHPTNKEMQHFFKSAFKHLPDAGSHFHRLMFRVQAYKRKRWMWTSVHRFLYNYSNTIVTWSAGIGTVLGVVQALLAFNPRR